MISITQLLDRTARAWLARGWRRVPAQLRERAFFTAEVENAAELEAMRDAIEAAFPSGDRIAARHAIPPLDHEVAMGDGIEGEPAMLPSHPDCVRDDQKLAQSPAAEWTEVHGHFPGAAVSHPTSGPSDLHHPIQNAGLFLWQSCQRALRQLRRFFGVMLGVHARSQSPATPAHNP